YINYLLTGRLVESVGNLIGHLPINSKKKTWFKKSDLLYPVINVELDKMTELVNPQEVMGTISAEASKLTGLSEGLRVIASGWD
ncbi:MAG: carbohydrate kinase, partial [Clostridia bacterium]